MFSASFGDCLYLCFGQEPDKFLIFLNLRPINKLSYSMHKSVIFCVSIKYPITARIILLKHNFVFLVRRLAAIPMDFMRFFCQLPDRIIIDLYCGIFAKAGKAKNGGVFVKLPVQISIIGECLLFQAFLIRLFFFFAKNEVILSCP